MRIFIVGFLLLAATPLFAQQVQKPAAPVVTASANLKELVFDWDPVPGARTYWLQQKVGTNPHVYFTRVGDRITGGRTRAAIPVSVHLQDWANIRYRVDACNTAGCTRSAEIYPRDLMLDTIGYVKASNTDAQDRFGRAVALSADGSTLAVSAEGESSNGVNGNQTNNAAPNAGAVYVYRRNGRTWTQEAYIKMPSAQSQTLFGGGGPFVLNTLAISEDGSLLAVGAPSRSIGNPGVSHEGTVYVYRRAANNTWSNLASLLSPSPIQGDYFGYSVDMSADGGSIKVNSLWPRQVDVEGQPVGRTFIFTRNGDTWEESAALPPYYPGDRCYTTRMNARGTVLVSSCLNPVVYEYRAVTMKLIGGAWLHVSDIPMDYFMSQQPMALDYFGTRLAINLGGGNDGGEASAGVGVYRWENSAWLQEVKIIQPRYNSGRSMSVGWAKALEFDRSGTFLAIGDAGAPFSGAGVMNPVQDGSEPHGGVYLFERRDAFWQSRTAIKAPNPAVDDQFGISLALSGNGHILAVGAMGEDSAATGIDGNRNSDGAQNAGAVYLY